LQARLDASERFNLSVATVLDAASQPGSTTAILLPPEGAAGPRGLATVQPDGTILLAMRGLEPTQGEQVYEVWVIAGSAAPVPVGNFLVGPDGSASVTLANTPAAAGVTLALTVEPRPGATTPTMPPRSLGVVSGGST
jgi:anti-sigma-K factor RskA